MPDTFDIAFSFDTTGSMYSCLEEVRKRLGDIVKELRDKIPGIRIAIFAHGDYCDAGKTYVTKYINFTSDSNQLCSFVRDVSRTGGGDIPECYELVMREVPEKLSWSRDSQKALVMTGDAPPHDKSEDQNYRHLDWQEETRRLRDMDIKIYAVECNGTHNQHFYQYIASRSFGYFMPLSNFNEVKELMMKICFREAGLDNAESTIDLPTDSDDGDSTCEDLGIRCFICKKVKPANEFPATPLSEDCEHNFGYCLRCAVEYVKEHEKCPYEGCNQEVKPTSPAVILYDAKLQYLFVDYAKVLEESRMQKCESGEPMLSVSALNGDTAWMTYKPDMTMDELTSEVSSQLGIKQSLLKILFEEKTLRNEKGPGQPYRLSDHGITANLTLTVIVPLYCIPEDLDHVVFDLSWEFPKHNPDFLDASCLAFEKDEFIQVIDWNHSTNDFYLKGAVEHTAKNEIAPGGRIGYQQMHVHLKRLPHHITHLYFTLSSWKTPNLSAFNNPSLNFYEASTPGANLCGTTIEHALNNQAVIICYVVRIGRQWQIYECGARGCVDGNAKKYNPIRQRIAEIIQNE